MTVEVRFLVRRHLVRKGEVYKLVTATTYTYIFHDAEDCDAFKAILDAIQGEPE